MCGIVGYIGPKQAQDVLISGLSKLEYRGYDSAGVAIGDGACINVRKKAGKLANLSGELGGLQRLPRGRSRGRPRARRVRDPNPNPLA